MEFEILNKTNDRVRAANANNIATITFSKTGRISFTGTAAELCNLRVGTYVHFVLLNKKTWLFYVNNDNNGYKLFKLAKSGSAQVLLESLLICKMHKEQFNHKTPARYYIQQTDHQHMGHPLFEILTHKPINEMGK